MFQDFISPKLHIKVVQVIEVSGLFTGLNGDGKHESIGSLSFLEKNKYILI